MRSSLLMSAALFGLLAGPAVAQNAVGNAQNPPSPGASSQMPQPANSAPPGSIASPMVTPGSNIGTTGTAPAVMAAPPPSGYVASPAPMVRPGRGTRHGTRQSRDDSYDPSAPPTSAYRGGAGSPYSTQASHINDSNGRSVVAPRLPDPGANTPEALLASAQRSLNQGRTGAAQEALERAETRILSRTTDPSMADVPDQAAMARHITAARRALGSRDLATAKVEVAAAMAAPIPPRGPTVTTTYPADPGLAAPVPMAPMPMAPMPGAMPMAPMAPAPMGYSSPGTYPLAPVPPGPGAAPRAF